MELQEKTEVVSIYREDLEMLNRQIRKLEDMILEKNKIIKARNEQIIELRAIISNIHKLSKI